MGRTAICPSMKLSARLWNFLSTRLDVGDTVAAAIGIAVGFVVAVLLH